MLDEAEQGGLAHLILSASTDAPAALLTNCIAVLDKFPALQSYLRDNPAMVKNFVEETLRYDGPAKNLCRQTTAEVTIAGVTIPADSRVMVLMGSANHDERVFPRPETFDLFRTFTTDNKILTFGEGIHSCMGAPIARLMAQVAVEELVAGLDGTEVRVVGTPERWAKQMVRGFASLPDQDRPDRAGRRGPQGAGLHRTPGDGAAPQHAAHPRHPRARDRGPRDGKDVVAEGVVRAHPAGPRTARRCRPWEPGAHVDLILGSAATRQYSLCGDPADRHTFRLGILRDPNGSGGSLYVHDRLQAGDTVRIRGPRNNFPLVDSPRYLFIAGGIGITPILAMIRSAEAAGAQWRLVYGGRHRASMAFLDELAAYGDRVTVWPQDEKGFIDLPGLLGEPQAGTKVYCCGPEPLLNAVEQNCAAWPEGSLHVERFVAKPLTEPVLHEAIEVHLAQSGLTLTVPPEKSILDAAEEAGIGVLSSCREGTCGTCETPVLDGIPDHRDSVLDAQARRTNDCMMICVSRACTPRLVLDL